MNNKELITKFYKSFSNGDIDSMLECYHEEVIFHDPAFGILKGDHAKNMWRMLLAKRDESTKIACTDITITEKGGKATWTASYKYGPKRRSVINNVTAQMEIVEGKIIRHTDTFDMWKWTQQALGFSGYLLGWSPFMKNKIQHKLGSMLREYEKDA